MDYNFWLTLEIERDRELRIHATKTKDAKHCKQKRNIYLKQPHQQHRKPEKIIMC